MIVKVAIESLEVCRGTVEQHESLTLSSFGNVTYFSMIWLLTAAEAMAMPAS